jgi:hypothetical protein
VSNAGAGVQGLPNVDPVYTWDQLAQRIPIRVAIDKVPNGIPLISGMTATVTRDTNRKSDCELAGRSWGSLYAPPRVLPPTDAATGLCRHRVAGRSAF